MFHLTIRTPYEDLFNGEVNSLTFSADESGEMQILDHHASLTAAISFSPIIIEEDNKDEYYLGRNGSFFFDNNNNKGVLLLNYCQKKSEVSYKSAKEYADYITKELEEGHELNELQTLYLSHEKIAVERQIEEAEEE